MPFYSCVLVTVNTAVSLPSKIFREKVIMTNQWTAIEFVWLRHLLVHIIKLLILLLNIVKKIFSYLWLIHDHCIWEVQGINYKLHLWDWPKAWNPKPKSSYHNPTPYHIWGPSMILMCSISLENNKSSQTVLAKHLSVILNQSVNQRTRSSDFKSSTLRRFKETSSIDETSRVVMEYVLKGWPSEKEQVDELAREHWILRKNWVSRKGCCLNQTE